MFNAQNTPVRNKTRLGLEALEDRRVMAAGVFFTAPIVMPPDHAGGTLATAQPVDLALMEQRTVSDFLPSSSDVDVFRVALRKGDFLVADADATGTSPLSGTLAILDGTARQLAFNQFGTEPESGSMRFEPALGFYAPVDGDYFVQAKTTSSSFSPGRSYNLNLQRIGMDDVSPSASELAKDGKFHAWLNQSGTSLTVAGPTGYGFALEGNWSSTRSGQNVSYQVNGPVTLRTTYLDGTVGALPLATGSDGFTVEVTAPGWQQLGELTSTSGGLGFSLGLLTEDLDEVLGIQLGNVAVASSWTIMTGEQVRANFPQHKITQVLDGVPYLVYGETGRLAAEVGSVRITTGDAQGTILIADPADPFLYAGYDDYAVAGSLEGRIPLNATATLPEARAEVPRLGNFQRAADEYFGHLYLAGEAPLAAFPVPLIGDLGFMGEAAVTVDLDADGDGQFLSGKATAHQLQSGDLEAVEDVLKDMRFSINGEVNVGFSFAGYDVQIPLGTASVYFSGPSQAIAFEGVQGAAGVWAGTPLEDFRSDTEIAIAGYAYRDGRFSVTSSSRYYLLGNYAELALTVRSEGTVESTEIVAAGSVHTWIGDAHVSGAIALNGDFTFTGTADFDIGNGDNYIRGQGSCVVQRTGSTTSISVDGTFAAQVKLDGVAKASGNAAGKLTMSVRDDGHISYSTNFGFSGKLYVWNPLANKLRGGWSEVGSASGGFGISSNKLQVSLGGHRFSVSLP